MKLFVGRTRRVPHVAGCAGILWAAAVAVAFAQGPARPQGVYTAAQADRGREQYLVACAHCHSTDLLGDPRLEIPSLAEDDFFVRWGGRTAADLFRMISMDMPQDKPGALPRAAYVDILAYILQVNHYPAGGTELTAEAAALAAVPLEPRRP